MTIVFSKSSPKSPKLGMFGLKIKEFCRGTKIWYKANRER